jgi:hypothetical protein
MDLKLLLQGIGAGTGVCHNVPVIPCYIPDSTATRKGHSVLGGNEHEPS